MRYFKPLTSGMTKTENKMDDKERIRLLEEQVEYLDKEKRAVLEAIELAANLGNFHTSLNKIDDPLVILRETYERVHRLLNFRAVSFYLVSEEDSNFYQALTEPGTEAAAVDREVNALIDDKTFAWTLRRNKPVTVSSIDKSEKIILHSMNTPSRTRGVFVGILASPAEEILDLSLFLFSITVIACSSALESFELYRQIKDKNKDLEKNIVQLEEEERKYRALFEQSTHSIILYDPETRMPVDFNYLANESLGYTAEEFKGKKMEDYSLSPLDDIVGKIRKTIEYGRHTFETQHKRKDGEVRDIVINARSIQLGGKVYLLTLLNDITQRKKAEEERIRLEKQLQQGQKMESLGTLAGGIAHDFNNILGVILGYGELMLMELPEDPLNTFRQHTGSLLKAVYRAKDLVQQILTFSRKGEDKREALNINGITKETLKLLRATLPPTIDIRQVIDGEFNVIMGTPGHVHQVIMNLCTNALHSMREGKGTLEIDVRTVTLDAGPVPGGIAVFDKMEAGEYVQITVSDSGHGIAQANLERVFDPYFTTKAPGEGTGLGLSVIHGIVKKYKGNASIESRVDKGTTARIWFPSVKSVEAPVKKEIETLPFGKETILLVDDEQELLKSLQQILRQLGYTVLACNSTTSALKVFLKNPDGIDLIITDMAMPVMTGLQFTRELINVRADIPIILCTGFSEFMDAKKAKDVGIREFLMKPVDRQTLATTIRYVLDKDYSSLASR